MKLYDLFSDKGFHTSLATSFGIDFDAYETIVLPRLRGSGCRNNIVVADSRMLTYALSNVTRLPAMAGSAYTVTGAAAKGVFHPKLFLQLGRRRGRLIVSSANLTTPGLAGNLEIAGVVECSESLSAEQQIIAQAWAYLSRHVSRDRGPAHQIDWLGARTPWLMRAQFSTGPLTLADGMRAALMTTGEEVGIGQRFAEFVDEPVSRLIVVSPYWDESLAALSYLIERLRPDEIAVVVDNARTQFPREALTRLNRVRVYDREGFQTGRFLHAKIVIAQTQDADHVLFGSANCTAAALGLGGFTGSNEEASLYRRLPAGSIVPSLKLETILVAASEIPHDKIIFSASDDELPYEKLTALNAGTFECLGDTLVWRPAAFPALDSTIELLDASGAPIGAELSLLPSVGTLVRFQIIGIQDPPHFARARLRDGALSAPSIITVIDRLRTSIRESSSKRSETVATELQDETEARVLLYEAIDILEAAEQAETAGAAPASIPKRDNSKPEAVPDHRILSYEEFIRGRRPRSQSQLPHNSLAGSEVSIVRATLNRIIGYGTGEIVAGADASIPDDLFDLADETADAQEAIRAGKNFGDKKRKRPELIPEQAEKNKIAEAKKASKDEILFAAKRFNARIAMRHKTGVLDNRDILRLRALLMVICTAAVPVGNKSSTVEKSRYQVLPAEGVDDGWPTVIGRSLFPVFGAPKPAILHFYLSTEHDQIPNDILECWAAVYWCVQACLTVPLSSSERHRVTYRFKRIADLSYRLTLPTKEEMLSKGVLNIMDRMSASYCGRVGVTPKAILDGHRRLVDSLFNADTDRLKVR
jgi:hypothetical protein